MAVPTPGVITPVKQETASATMGEVRYAWTNHGQDAGRQG